MSDPKDLVTTQEFAKKAEVSAATVSKWLRSGRVIGSKENGKWMISADQLAKIATSNPEIFKSKPTADKKSSTSEGLSDHKGATRVYTIVEFSAMTYLTPFGVERYLKEGRLTGGKDASGQWGIDASNLEKSDIQRLLRK